MTAWYQLANNGQRKLVILAVMGLSIVFTGCPQVAVKPEASTDQTAKNVQDLASKVETMNGNLTQTSQTVNQFKSQLEQFTTTASDGAAAVAKEVKGDLENLNSSLGGKIGVVEGKVEQTVKNTTKTNTNNPLMVWGIVLGVCIMAFAFVYWMVRFVLNLMADARKSKNLLQAALIDNGNDLNADKLDGLHAKIDELKSKGVL